MAKKSATSKKAVTIPASERKAVTAYRGVMVMRGHKNPTDEQAYEALLRDRYESAKEQAKQQQKAEREQARERREQAIEALRRGLTNLTAVCSLLARMERGDDQYFCAEAQATFARATLSDAGADVERALRDLGLLEQKRHGYFVPDRPEQPEAREASHG